MAFLKKDVKDALIARYRDDLAETLQTVADAFGTDVGTARHYIAKAGIAIRDVSDMTDRDLGIASPDIEDITSSKAFRDAVSAAVRESIGAQMGAGGGMDFAAFMSEMRQLTSAFQQQSPGYNKPISPEEVARRQEGGDGFFRLIAEASEAVENFGRQGAAKRGLVPEYLVGANGIYAPTDNGEEMFSPGQRLFYTEPPPRDFTPLNELAAGIMHTQMVWLGLPTPGPEKMLANGLIVAAGGDPFADDRKRGKRNSNMAEVVPDSGVVEIGPRKIMGTSIEGVADDGRARFSITKGQVARPVSGPVFA